MEYSGGGPPPPSFPEPGWDTTTVASRSPKWRLLQKLLLLQRLHKRRRRLSLRTARLPTRLRSRHLLLEARRSRGRGSSAPSVEVRKFLTDHMRIQTGDKPFDYHLCPKRFADASNLRVHEKTHSPEKAFQSADCDKRLALSLYLKKHVKRRLHKPLPC
ncbi:hypothetical protein QR680_013675 [Steinernema hermaphroditum]|uniref:C2H2-type domain-containing protein n=1 Tax=Steinernema hermaphroditum TaxID=289476 RepID=A0AA39M1X5_9BILA|nr:hypothetical protein QR680_013675 [Steinernema hermaphroditum]